MAVSNCVLGMARETIHKEIHMHLITVFESEDSEGREKTEMGFFNDVTLGPGLEG